MTAFAGLAQWEAWVGTQRTGRAPAKTAGGGAQAVVSPPKRKKLSFNDQRDFDTIESRILAAEATLAELTAECAKPDVVSNASRLVELDAEMSKLKGEIDRLYARWAELSNMVAL